MSPKRLVISTTYKTRVALEKPCKKHLRNRYWTAKGQASSNRKVRLTENTDLRHRHD